jgi:hypothetical protein
MRPAEMANLTRNSETLLYCTSECNRLIISIPKLIGVLYFADLNFFVPESETTSLCFT